MEEKIVVMPLLLGKNRVHRTYKGGLLLDQWQKAKEPKDSFIPEQWVSSTINSTFTGFKHEGLSQVENFEQRKQPLIDIIKTAPATFLGKSHIKNYGEEMGILIKMLDSCERLAIQVHPTQSFVIMVCRPRS